MVHKHCGTCPTKASIEGVKGALQIANKKPLHNDDGTLFMWGQGMKDDGFGFYSESVLDMLVSAKGRPHCRSFKKSSTKLNVGNNPVRRRSRRIGSAGLWRTWNRH